MKSKTKVHLIKYVGNHTIAINHPERSYEIRKLDNIVIVKVNKLAKENDGEGPQLHIEAGERITTLQAEQIARTYEVSVTPVYSESENIQTLLD